MPRSEEVLRVSEAPERAAPLLHFGGAGSPYERALQCFAAHFPAGTLRSVRADPTLDEKRLLHMIRKGEAAGGIVTTGTLGEITSGFFVGDLPYLWTSPGHAARFWKSGTGRRLIASAEPAGIRVLAVYDAGTRHIFNRLRPTRRPAELGWASAAHDVQSLPSALVSFSGRADPRNGIGLDP